MKVVTTLAPNLQTQNRKKVVVIEDDPVWQQILQHCLLNVDNTTDVKIVSSAAEFRARRQHNEELDLIIADQNLGDGETGLEIWKEFRSRKNKTAFLLTSGIERREFLTLTKGHSSAPAFATKSLSDGALIENIRKLLGDSAKASHAKASQASQQELDKQASGYRLMLLSVFLIGSYGGLLLYTSTFCKPAPSLKKIETHHVEKSVPAFGSQSHPTLPSISLPEPGAPPTIGKPHTHRAAVASVRHQLSRIIKRASRINAETRSK